MTLALPAVPDRSPHPLVRAALVLASDLASSIVFAIVLQVTRAPVAATVLAVAAGLAQAAWKLMRGRRIDTLQATSLALVIVLGGASLYARDVRVMMLKPSLVYAVVGAAMLRKGWMTPYLPKPALALAPDVCVIFGRIWAGLMVATAGLNLVVVVTAPGLWAGFIGIFPLLSKAVLIGVQYVVTRKIAGDRAAFIHG